MRVKKKQKKSKVAKTDARTASKLKIGIVAPSSCLATEELRMGEKSLVAAGFEVESHSFVLGRDIFYSETIEKRAQSIIDFAYDNSIDVLWSARGGYGSGMLLPLLEKETQKRGIPRQKKVYVGYSDATAILEFVRSHWKWNALHAPMAGHRSFQELSSSELEQIYSVVKGERVPLTIEEKRLTLLSGVPTKKTVDGPMIGGNLATFTALLGTPFFPKTKGGFLFFEDIDETPSRIFRMWEQLYQAKAFEGVNAILLGGFTVCEDIQTTGWMREGSQTLEPIRPKLEQLTAFREFFAAHKNLTKLPVWTGVPVGHGKEKAPLPLGGEYSLSPNGELRLIRWGKLK